MSDSASNAHSTSRPPSVRRSTATERLPRLSSSNGGFMWPPYAHARPRNGSPPSGSILTTSAPQSARIDAHAGAANHSPSSTTRTPSNGPLTDGVSRCCSVTGGRPYWRVEASRERDDGAGWEPLGASSGARSPSPALPHLAARCRTATRSTRRVLVDRGGSRWSGSVGACLGPAGLGSALPVDVGDLDVGVAFDRAGDDSRRGRPNVVGSFGRNAGDGGIVLRIWRGRHGLPATRSEPRPTELRGAGAQLSSGRAR